MTADERIASLEEHLKQALEQVHILQGQLATAQKRIEELEKQKTPSPAFVKANVKKPQAEEKKQRRKRDGRHNHGRPRATSTQVVEHRIVTCPDCALRLGGISLARMREVIEVPRPSPVEITHHRIFKGWCGQCQKWHEAPVDLSAEVLGLRKAGSATAQSDCHLAERHASAFSADSGTLAHAARLRSECWGDRGSAPPSRGSCPPHARRPVVLQRKS